MYKILTQFHPELFQACVTSHTTDLHRLLSFLLEEHLQLASEAIVIKGRGTWEDLEIDRDLIKGTWNKPATTGLGNTGYNRQSLILRFNKGTPSR